MPAVKEEKLIAEREKAQVKIHENKVALHKAKLEAEELNVKLIQAGLQRHVIASW